MNSLSIKLKTIIIMASILAMTAVGYAQTTVKWLTWDEAMEKSKHEKRKFFVDVYTDWCGWCKKMDKATFQRSDVAEYLNENYYAIKFNAEQKEDIRLKDKVYKFVKDGARGYHELAVEITYGKLSYPTIVFLDENAKVIQPISGFKEASMFKMIASYFAEDHFKKTPWKKYAATHSKN